MLVSLYYPHVIKILVKSISDNIVTELVILILTLYGQLVALAECQLETKEKGRDKG